MEQKEVAAVLGFKYKTYLSWETSALIPENKYFPKIIEFLGYNPLQIDTATISGKIKLCSVLNGLTRQELSKILGISVIALKRIETGEKTSLKVQNILTKMLLDKN